MTSDEDPVCIECGAPVDEEEDDLALCEDCDEEIEEEFP